MNRQLNEQMARQRAEQVHRRHVRHSSLAVAMLGRRRDQSRLER